MLKSTLSLACDLVQPPLIPTVHMHVLDFGVGILGRSCMVPTSTQVEIAQSNMYIVSLLRVCFSDLQEVSPLLPLSLDKVEGQ